MTRFQSFLRDYKIFNGVYGPFASLYKAVQVTIRDIRSNP